jgi:hypothetical protein
MFRLYDYLLSELKKIKAMTGDPHIDRYRFIPWTTQTLKMQLDGPEKSSAHQKCAIASKLLDELGTIPITFLQSSSVITVRLVNLLHEIGTLVHWLSASSNARWPSPRRRWLIIPFLPRYISRFGIYF